jgi:hypothetical protein
MRITARILTALPIAAFSAAALLGATAFHVALERARCAARTLNLVLHRIEGLKQ